MSKDWASERVPVSGRGISNNFLNFIFLTTISNSLMAGCSILWLCVYFSIMHLPAVGIWILHTVVDEAFGSTPALWKDLEE